MADDSSPGADRADWRAEARRLTEQRNWRVGDLAYRLGLDLAALRRDLDRDPDFVVNRGWVRYRPGQGAGPGRDTGSGAAVAGEPAPGSAEPGSGAPARPSVREALNALRFHRFYSGTFCGLGDVIYRLLQAVARTGVGQDPREPSRPRAELNRPLVQPMLDWLDARVPDGIEVVRAGGNIGPGHCPVTVDEYRITTLTGGTPVLEPLPLDGSRPVEIDLTGMGSGGRPASLAP